MISAENYSDEISSWKDLQVLRQRREIKRCFRNSEGNSECPYFDALKDVVKYLVGYEESPIKNNGGFCL